MTIQTMIHFPPVTAITPDTTIGAAMNILFDEKISHLPVCEAGKYIGMVWSGNILAKLLPVGSNDPHGMPDLKFAGDAAHLLKTHYQKLHHHPVSVVMHHPVPLELDCPLLEAALRLSQHHEPMPVIDSEGRLAGLLGRHALLAFLSGNPER